MSENATYTQGPDPLALYTLLVLNTGICGYFFFMGLLAVRVWFYRGALGPALQPSSETPSTTSLTSR
ncbi:hypothetical protein yc1106_07486 [Curvularia clavata]|uniref:Uncharacterized protein n=1 Tax=Curvularia clavata TaxID=95742 RepID=A0A9Q9DUV6_CURCL|nr:hypothetical protein yc1106_07486 [Curvularia clavata]